MAKKNFYKDWRAAESLATEWKAKYFELRYKRKCLVIAAVIGSFAMGFIFGIVFVA